jgi:Tfp pilus assembly protein PilN
MRPINLIPEEERRAHGGAARTGPLAFIVVGALGLLLIGVLMVVLASNEIGDREDEVAKLEARKIAVTARAELLSPYASFEQVAQQRIQSVAALADNRFDWERIMRQLALILPPEVNLTSLTGSAGGGTEGTETGLSTPSLALTGCAPGQESVATIVAALKQIDGVTRVGLSNSTVAEEKQVSGDGGCSRRRSTEFEIVVAFDQAPASVDSGEVEEVASPAETAEGTASETESTESEGSEEAAEGTASAASPGGSG